MSRQSDGAVSEARREGREDPPFGTLRPGFLAQRTREKWGTLTRGVQDPQSPG